MHVGTVGGAAVVVAVDAGAVRALVLLPVAAVVGCARVRTGRQTAGQVVVGAVLGATAAAAVHPVLAG